MYVVSIISWMDKRVSRCRINEVQDSGYIEGREGQDATKPALPGARIIETCRR